MPKPLVSVCVPCHNAGPYVAQALKSLFEQTYRDFEVIVVNDASTDTTAEILDTFKDPRLTVINQKCGSASKARNLAFANSKGVFIKFFDADDIISPGMIEKQVARIEHSERSIATCEWGRFQKKNLSSYTPNRQSVWRDMSSKEWLIESFRDARPMMQPGVFLIPRNLIEEVGPWSERLSPIDDFEFFSRLLSAANEIKFCDGQTFYYRSGLGNKLAGEQTREAVQGTLDSLLSGTACLLDKKSTKPAQMACANLLQDFIFTQYPDHEDLRKIAAERIKELGGSSIEPDGPPQFHHLRRFFGWKLARRIQRLLSK
ncbi:glycosyltransferase family 2 protein [Verrucomicrobiaceae bacterium 227]